MNQWNENRHCSMKLLKNTQEAILSCLTYEAIWQSKKCIICTKPYN